MTKELVSLLSMLCLTKLEQLSLDNNKLSSVFHLSFLPLTSLNSLNIHQNPWNCTCKLKPFIQVSNPGNVCCVVIN